MAENTAAATHNGASDASIESDSLCNFASFVTNSREILTISRKLSPDEASVLCSLLVSGSEIEHLAIQEELPPGAGTQLGLAIATTARTIRTLSLGRIYSNFCECKPAPELFRMLTSANSATLEQIAIYDLSINDWCEHNSFGQFVALRSLVIHTGKDCDRSLPSIIASISRLRALESLRIEGISFTPADIETLVTILKDLPLIVELGICYAQLGAQTGRTIGNLVALGRIRKLDLTKNVMKCEEIAAMVDAILGSSRRCELQELILYDNDFNLVGERKLVDLASHSPRLRVLDLHRNLIPGAFLCVAATRSLEELNVSNCLLMLDEVESMLLDTPGAFPALRVLLMNDNWLDDACAGTIAKFIAVSGGRTLTKLGVKDNHITETGALELARAFEKAYAMRTINLSSNEIRPHGATAVMDALATASTEPMDKIRFSNCYIGDAGAEAAGRLIARRGCKSVILYTNAINAAGAKAIADSVAESVCVVQNLDLSANPLGPEGVKYLLDKMRFIHQKQSSPRNRGVRELGIVSIRMEVEGAMAVKRAVEAHDILDRLRASEHSADTEADEILKGVRTWERNSKPPWTAILKLV